MEDNDDEECRNQASSSGNSGGHSSGSRTVMIERQKKHRLVTTQVVWKRLGEEEPIAAKIDLPLCRAMLLTHSESPDPESPEKTAAASGSCRACCRVLLDGDDPRATQLLLLQQLQQLCCREIRTKMTSYRYQDTKNKRIVSYSDEECAAPFVSVPSILDLIVRSNMNCFYCFLKVDFLYENVREPRQWTLERIDNSLGHVDGNVVLSCLRCNVRRRLMNPERYLLTKKLVRIVKLVGESGGGAHKTENCLLPTSSTESAHQHAQHVFVLPRVDKSVVVVCRV